MQKARPLGRISRRKLLCGVTALLVTVFAYIFVITPHVHAASDATWVGASIQYNGDQYDGPVTATGKESFKLPAGTQIYSHVDEAQPGQTAQKAHFIYFAKGVDVSKATSAKYVEYIYTPPDQYKNASNQKTISIDNSTYGQGASGCNIPGSLSWIVCPVSDFLANFVDTIYGYVVGYLVVQPAQLGQHGDMFIAWNIMRSIANIAFVITFLIIIYSQLTNMGVSNYGIKKLLPRLIVAAVLVNVSYYICAAAIDVSNILGYSVQQIFINIRSTVFNHAGTPNTSGVLSWSSIVGFVLSGGTTAVALGIGSVVAISATGGTIASAIFLLLPAMLGLLLGILVALLILAARQAIIVLLLIISPLAFVAYLLPGTEKWFDKWQDLFTTMLIFFPAFSAVYGGAQLAGSLIIQNASSINMLILGMIVQVAPLAIAPLLLKLSGSVLSKVAGVVNNPNKGLIDRTRNWSKERAEMHRQRGLGDGKRLSGIHFLRNTARKVDDRERYVKERTGNYSAMSDNRYNSSKYHTAQDEIRRHVAEEKEIIEKELDIKWNTIVERNPHAIEQDLKLRVLSDQAALGKLQLDNRYEEVKVGTFPLYGHETESMVDILNRAQDTAQHLAVEGIRTQAAKHIQQKSLAQALSVDLNDNGSNRAEYQRGQDLLTIAGGIDPDGKFNAQADAMSNLVKMEGEGLTKSLQYLNARAIREGTTLQKYTANVIADTIDGKVQHSDNILKAALEQQAIEGQVGIIENALGSFNIDRSIVADVIARNNNTMKAKGGFHVQSDPMKLSIQAIRDEIQLQGGDVSDGNIRRIFNERMAAGRMDTLASSSAKDIAGWKVGYFVNTVAANIDEQIALAKQFAEHSGSPEVRAEVERNLEAAFANIHSATINKDIMAEMSNRHDQLTGISTAFREANVPLRAPAVEAYENKIPEEKIIDGQPLDLE